MALTEEQQEDADLEAGFAKPTPPETTEKPVVVEVKADHPPKPDEKPPEPKVEYVQLTKEEHGRLLAIVDKTNAWQTQLDRVHGTVGAMNEVVKKLQAATTPRQVKMILAKTRENYPDLADSIEADMEEAMKSAPSEPIEEPKKTTEEKPPEKSITEQLNERRDQENMQMLDEAHPKWKETVGFSQTEEQKKTNPYRIWLASEDDDYQKTVNNTRSAFTIARSIDRFNAYQRRQAKLKQQGAPPQKRPDPKVVARQDRIAGSVQPRGDGAPPPRKDSSQDEFEGGFYR